MFLPNNDMNAYLTDMRMNGTWGDHIVLVSLAHALGRTIRIVSSLGDSSDVIVEPDNHYSAPILLGHVSERHYVSLEPINVSGICIEDHAMFSEVHVY